ncbi:outer membrane lipoprotein-sorting protein [Pseudodesulfovibrio sp. S3]|nr:outer membrane lipoprotein-sorting protein [Pseudodesulfovibrio sp. S3-i]MCJ2163535.1 outer membrane lipoprotein-sorting protein [Pseudodesulfovibrio sp. S3-i]RWU06770.1 outer membrane lipoprotein-sorting protein [Pseudodesulfovibrio sp. S3]
MKRCILVLAVITALSLMISAVCPATELDAEAIITRANHVALYQGETCKGKVTFTITDSQDRVRIRELNILRKDMPGCDQAQKYMTYFKAPADVRKMTFLVHKTVEPGQDDARWLYMPGLDLVKRIAAGDKRTSFAGSDFLYEDISGRNTSEDRHERQEDLEGYYVIKNTPKNPEGVEFTHYLAYIDRKTFIPMKVDYYKGDTLYRVMEVLNVEEIATQNGDKVFPTVTESMFRNLETGSSTVMSFSDIKYDIPLEEDIFSERYLRRPPKEVMR